MSPIQQFIQKVQRRLNLAWAFRLSAWLLLVLGLIWVGYASLYRVRGEAVPWLGFGMILFYVVMIGAAWWWLRRRNESEAAREADETLGLKDSLSSFLAFEGREDEIYQAQRQRTESLVEVRDVKEFSYQISRPLLAGGGVLAAVAIWMGSLPPSEAVQERLTLEAETEERTEEIQQELEELLKEVLADLDEDEKEALDVNELKQWVKELKRTKDQKEALRQLARFEQKITEAMKGLKTSEDQESLKLAAAELAKSDQSAARQLGKKLDLKEYKLAEEDLKKAAQKAKKSQADKAGEPKKARLSEKEMKKLREMTKRMANAARRRGAQKSNGQRGQLGKAAGKMGQGAKGGKMDQMLKDLDAAAKDAEQALEEMDGDLEAMEGAFERFDGELNKFRGKLRRLHGKNKAKKRLAKMRGAMSRAQSYAMGQCQTLGLAQSNQQGAGGKKAGVGTNESRRKERDALENNANYANLQGQMGQGPSITAVEDAEDGTGVSGRTGEAKAREFQRQMESFVRRDDVPEDVKMGVKEYFNRVHQVQESQQ